MPRWRLKTASAAVTGDPSQKFAFALSVKSYSVGEGEVYVAMPGPTVMSGVWRSSESHSRGSTVFSG